MAWPNYRAARSAYLDGQTPLKYARHAVTIVGYRSKGGGLEGTEFIFKNSWGASWGRGGYGTVTYAYLRNHLDDAVLLEVQSD